MIISTNDGLTLFGPYTQVEEFVERLVCDGAELPTSVIGKYSIVEEDPEGPACLYEWIGGVYVLKIPPPKPSPSLVPYSVSPRQIRQALTRVNLRESVESNIAAGDQDTKDWYEYATAFERTNSHVIATGVALGVSSDQLDDLWRLAGSL